MDGLKPLSHFFALSNLAVQPTLVTQSIETVIPSSERWSEDNRFC